jgi:hypothetical protein
VTDVNMIELIRELSKVCIDQAIAATLNRLGYRTGTGKTWPSRKLLTSVPSRTTTPPEL